MRGVVISGIWCKKLDFRKILQLGSREYYPERTNLQHKIFLQRFLSATLHDEKNSFLWTSNSTNKMTNSIQLLCTTIDKMFTEFSLISLSTLFTINFGAINFDEKYFGEINFEYPKYPLKSGHWKFSPPKLFLTEIHRK